MVSKTLLAVSIPLAFILLLSFLAISILAKWIKIKEEESSSQDKQISSLKFQLNSRPPIYAYHPTSGIPEVTVYCVKDFFWEAKGAMHEFIDAWIVDNEIRVDSEERITNLLFQDPTENDSGFTRRGRALFPNPQNYTAHQICEILTTGWHRSIIHHILSSIIFPAVTLRMEGDPFSSLLPFRPEDLIGLVELMNMTEGREFSWEVDRHLSQYAVYHAEPGLYGNRPWATDNHRLYVDLIEALIKPYLITKTDEATDTRNRRSDIEKMLDGAVMFGMKALQVHRNPHIVTWGSRELERISVTPAFWCMQYKNAGDGDIVEPVMTDNRKFFEPMVKEGYSVPYRTLPSSATE